MKTQDLGTKLDEFYRRKVSEPVARQLAPHGWVTPNRVSLAAFLAGGIVTPALILHERLLAAGMAFLVSDFLDYVDGDVARAQRTASPEGDILDGILDRFTDFFSLSALMIFAMGLFSESGPPVAAAIGVPDSKVALLVGLAAIFGSMMPSYIKAVATANGRRTTQSIGGRGTRNRLLIVGLLLGQALWTLVVIAVAANAATLHRAWYSVRNRR
jgi:phosphatidylglycerophosphate synthase